MIFKTKEGKMFFTDILLAFAFALLFAGLFSLVFKRTGPWASFVVLFIVIFLAAWAGGVWIRPVGPALFGIYWLPFLIVGLILALLMAAAAGSSRPPRTRMEAIRQAEEKAEAERAFDAFFWVFIIIMVAIIVLGYLYPRAFI